MFPDDNAVTNDEVKPPEQSSANLCDYLIIVFFKCRQGNVRGEVNNLDPSGYATFISKVIYA
jgi:hypothetical protein